MVSEMTALAARTRVLIERALSRLGLREESILVVLAFVIGLLAAAAAVGFHELIHLVREWLYSRQGQRYDLYGTGLGLLILFPTLGGLAVGCFSRYIMRQREGHGIIDVMESVLRSSGYIKRRTAIEKILTSGVTIGTGGSAGAEGPIVQIGASIASAVGQVFRLSRHHMPVLIGCGSAAGISAIFNAPIGGLLFTLEVILRDFSIRALTPIVVASVVANFTTRAIFRGMLGEEFVAILDLAPMIHGQGDMFDFRFPHLGNFLVLGLICGVVGVMFTRFMQWSEGVFSRLRFPRALKPAMGGALLGVLGVVYILVFRGLFDGSKPFGSYDLPAFFSDGYGAIKQMLSADFYNAHGPIQLVILLGSLIFIKILATALTLSSGGSGGVIAPSLFVGATTGGFLGLLLQHSGWFSRLDPNVYALIGMSGVLAAVVHAPLASILILQEVSGQYEAVLPAMLCAFIATSVAQLIYRDSIYTLGLRQRGVSVGTSADLSLLRRMSVEQVLLEPATFVRLTDPFQKVLNLVQTSGDSNFVVLDKGGYYAGMITEDAIKAALLEREAVPLLTVSELVRPEIPTVPTSDDLASVLDRFSQHDVSRLPVSIPGEPFKVVGLVSRSALMKQYRRALEER